MKKHRIAFLPSGKTKLVVEGMTVREAARLLNVGLETICGERVSCGKCKVQVLTGDYREFGIDSRSEHLDTMGEPELAFSQRSHFQTDERLACQARIQGDLVIFIPVESRSDRPLVRKSAGKRDIKIDPIIKKYYLELSSPRLEDLEGDWERLQRELNRRFGFQAISIDPLVLRLLSSELRRANWKVTLTVWDAVEVIRIEPGYSERALGLAIDIGTTTLAAYLCDLASGEILSSEGILNPQIQFGEDVMTRIAYAQRHPSGQQEMNQVILSGLNELAGNITSRVGCTPQDIVDVVVVGNTAMHHLFLNLDVVPLGRSPFTPAIKQALNIKAREIGLGVLPSGYVYVLPIEAGFVGADNVGVLIAEEPYNQDEIVLIIDIGTNGELALGNRAHLISASCATGPAFEGASIKFGLRAAPGAIEKVCVDPKTYNVRFKVIGSSKWSDQKDPQEVQAIGICGSGIVDAVAEMLAAGIITKSGSLNPAIKSKRLKRSTDKGWEFVLARAEQTAIGQDITITVNDVRAIQLAKAALYAGAEIMMDRLGITRPDRVVLAGAFGSEIDRKRALMIGMFPDCGLENIQAVGNAAGDGARLALLSREKRKEAETIARQVEYLELTVEPGFQKAFIAATHLPHMMHAFPSSEKVEE